MRTLVKSFTLWAVSTAFMMQTVIAFGDEKVAVKVSVKSERDAIELAKKHFAGKSGGSMHSTLDEFSFTPMKLPDGWNVRVENQFHWFDRVIYCPLFKCSHWVGVTINIKCDRDGNVSSIETLPDQPITSRSG